MHRYDKDFSPPYTLLHLLNTVKNRTQMVILFNTAFKCACSALGRQGKTAEIVLLLKGGNINY